MKRSFLSDSTKDSRNFRLLVLDVYDILSGSEAGKATQILTGLHEVNNRLAQVSFNTEGPSGNSTS